MSDVQGALIRGSEMLAGQLTEWETRWKALEEWLSQARGRDYVTRTPAVVLQKMRDLMGDES